MLTFSHASEINGTIGSAWVVVLVGRHVPLNIMNGAAAAAFFINKVDSNVFFGEVWETYWGILAITIFAN